MRIIFLHSTWGLEEPTLEAQLERIARAGYDGVHLDVPDDPAACRAARRCLDRLGLEVVAQECRVRGPDVAAHCDRFAASVERARELRPLFLNSHTGCDHLSAEENLAIFDRVTELAARAGIRLLHETHRGRALYSAPATESFLRARPGLRLTADFSHWCCVHESLLEDQPERMTKAIAHCDAIHARVGHGEGPQVPDPREAVWQASLEAHLAWWKAIAERRRAAGAEYLTVCPEAGPFPYTTPLPGSGRPIADLWEINGFLRDWLRERL